MQADQSITRTQLSSLLPLARFISHQLAETKNLLVVAIDGRSGAGKSTIAHELATLLKDSSEISVAPHLNIFHLENMYQGWEGLRPAVIEWRELVEQLKATSCGTWTGWNWTTSKPLPRQHLDLRKKDDAPVVLIAEGVGAFCADVDVTCWIERPAPLRKAAALQRDGETYRPFWDIWAAQEEALFEEYAEHYQHADFEILIPHESTITE